MTTLLLVVAAFCIIIGFSEIIWPRTDFWVRYFWEDTIKKYNKTAFMQAHAIASIIAGLLLIPAAFDVGPIELWVALELTDFIIFWLYLRMKCRP